MVLLKFSAVAERKARTPRSEAELNFSRLLRLLTVLQRGDERQKTGEFLLSRFPKKVHLIYAYSYKHFLSIEKAERLNARLILLFAVQIDFYAEIFDRKE